MSISVNKIGVRTMTPMIGKSVQNNNSVDASQKFNRELTLSKEGALALKSMMSVSFKGEEHNITYQDGLKFDYLMVDGKKKNCEVYDRLNDKHEFSMKYDDEEYMTERTMYNSAGLPNIVDRFDKGVITETDYYDDGEISYTHVYTEEDHKEAKRLLKELMEDE